MVGREFGILSITGLKKAWKPSCTEGECSPWKLTWSQLCFVGFLMPFPHYLLFPSVLNQGASTLPNLDSGYLYFPGTCCDRRKSSMGVSSSDHVAEIAHKLWFSLSFSR